MIGLKMFKIAYFGLQFIEIFQRRGLRPRTPCCNCRYSVRNRFTEKSLYLRRWVIK